MKNKNQYLVLFAILILALISGCGGGGEEDPEPTDEIAEMLQSKTWFVESVQIGGTDQTSLFNGMTLRFTDSEFTTTKGGKVWPVTGSWTFTGSDNKSFIRNDDIVVTIEHIDEERLVLELYWPDTTIGPGRNKSLEGTHRFEFF